MQTILRYEVPLERKKRGVFPYSDRILRVEHLDHGAGVDIWVHRARTDKFDGNNLRQIVVTATGEAAPDSWVYLGSTGRHPEIGVVWHAWEVHD